MIQQQNAQHSQQSNHQANCNTEYKIFNPPKCVIQKTTFSHRQPEWTRQLLIGKSQIIYQCKYRYIH